MLKNLCIMLLLSSGLLYEVPAHAEIFKWIDANGMTHYSDKAPKKRASKSMSIGQIKKKSVPKQSTRITRQSITYKAPTKKPRQKPAPKRQVRVVRKPTPIAKRYQAPKPVYDLELISKKALKIETIPVVVPDIKPKTLLEDQPDLDAVEYDLRTPPTAVQKPIINVKLKLCTEARMSLAALQEEGFNGYYDEEGQYRVAWGGDSVYQGKRRYLSEEEIAEKIKKVGFEVKQYCDDPYDEKRQNDARADWIRAEYCTVNKAFLEELEHPFMRTTDSDISNQSQEVERFCSELKRGQYRDDTRYYPEALQTKIVVPRHRNPLYNNPTKPVVSTPEETLAQLLALID